MVNKNAKTRSRIIKKPATSDRFAVYNKDLWTKHNEMDYSDWHSSWFYEQILLYAEINPDFQKSDKGPTNLKKEMEYCLVIQSV